MYWVFMHIIQKGLRNNGSHIIDLINYLFGDNYDLNSIKIIDIVDDYIKNDKSISFQLTLNIIKIIFQLSFKPQMKTILV